MARADAGWTYQGVGIGIRTAGHMDRCDLMGSAGGSSPDYRNNLVRVGAAP